MSLRTSRVLSLLGLVAFFGARCSLPKFDFEAPPELTCDNGMQDGQETDRDCGGGCDKCKTGLICRIASDCIIGSCFNQRCQAEHCEDQKINEGESDEDCGGGACPKCGVHQDCVEASDCTSNACMDGECIPTSCDDEETDGTETDLNCGGDVCPNCGIGKRCETGGDCETGICLAERCSTEQCGDGQMNGDEQGVDCGGSCPKPCDSETNCSNEKQSENETGKDCGGGTCPRCVDGEGCKVNADCMSDYCKDSVCGTDPCANGACAGGGAGGDGGAGGSGGTAGADDGGSSNGGTSAGGRTAAGGTSQGGSGGTSGSASGGTSQGGTMSGGAANGGTSMGGSMGGAVTLPEPTCSGCARLSLPLKAAADKANFAISLPNNRTDFSNATLTIRVYRQSGSGGQIKGYIQHGGQPDFLQLFQDTPVELASVGDWQNVVWNVGAQASSYDKTNVGRVGVQVTGAGATSWTNPTVVYVDSISVTGASTGPWNFDNSGTVSPNHMTGGGANILFCNSGDSPVSGTTINWYTR